MFDSVTFKLLCVFNTLRICCTVANLAFVAFVRTRTALLETMVVADGRVEMFTSVVLAAIRSSMAEMTDMPNRILIFMLFYVVTFKRPSSVSRYDPAKAISHVPSRFGV